MARLATVAVCLAAVIVTSACTTEPDRPPPPPPPPPAPPAVASVVVTPAQAAVETGSTVQLSAQPRDASDNPLTGRAVAWSSNRESIAVVSGSGLVTGVAAGTATISATSEGVSGSAEVEVTAPLPVAIAQIAPATMVEGQTATITGTGFKTPAAANVVTVAGVAATVTQATPTTITFTVPAVCVPKGDPVPVQVRVGALSSGAVPHPVAPASVLQLAVGEQVIAGDPAALCLQLDASGASERYLVGVQSIAAQAGAPTSLTVEAAIAGGAAPVAPIARPAAAAPIGPAVDLATRRDLARWQRHLRATAESYERNRPMLQRLAAAGPAVAARAPSVPGTVVEGDLVGVKVPNVDGHLCNDFVTVSGRVRKIGARGIFVEDEANAALLAQSVFDDASAAFDVIYGIDEREFGPPGDFDANGRIVIVVTNEVNKATSGLLGFVSSGNVFVEAQCSASNEGEYFFMRGLDPAGQFTATGYSAQRLARDFPNLLIHELAHIIQVGRRLAVGGQLMSWYLAEGLATAAQEVAGFEILGLTNGANYGPSHVYSTHGADERVFFGHLTDLIAYFGYDFNGGRIAGAPEQCTWAGFGFGTADLGPCSQAIRIPYGVTWSLIRHAIDRHHGGPAGQRAVFRAFSEYAGETGGYRELEAVLGRPIGQLLAEWAPALYIDDRFPGLTDFQFANWNVRQVAAAWASPNAELAARVRGFARFEDMVQVRAGSTAFFDVSGAGRPATTLRVRGAGGAPAPAIASLWVVRVE